MFAIIPPEMLAAMFAIALGVFMAIVHPIFVRF